MTPDPLKKNLHPQAVEFANQHIDNFATALISQAKLLAFRRNAELVLCNDISEALDIIGRARSHSRWRQMAMIVGSAFFGAFIQGFITELLAGNKLQVGIYTAMGFGGLFLVFWGLRD